MATAKTAVKNGAGRRRRGWLSIVLLVVAVAGGAYWMWREPIDGYAVAGASYGAHAMCSCRYIGGRDLSDCKKDFEPGMEFVFLTEDEDERTVTARVPLIASETARYSEGRGCLLDPWDE